MQNQWPITHLYPSPSTGKTKWKQVSTRTWPLASSNQYRWGNLSRGATGWWYAPRKTESHVAQLTSRRLTYMLPAKPTTLKAPSTRPAPYQVGQRKRYLTVGTATIAFLSTKRTGTWWRSSPLGGGTATKPHPRATSHPGMASPVDSTSWSPTSQTKPSASMTPSSGQITSLRASPKQSTGSTSVDATASH